jgi:2-phospho-L-lactate guanylyltransferase
MLSDVLNALTETRSLAGIIVVTGDATAASIARAAGARVLADTQNTGTTAAVTCAARHVAGIGGRNMLFVPADVPTITPADIGAIAAAHRAGRSVTLVPATFDGGTNALACSPPAGIGFCFGDDSYRRHCLAAKACGIEPRVLELPRVGQDIDRPGDLAAMIARPSRTRTYAYLQSSGIAQRLAGDAPSPAPERPIPVAHRQARSRAKPNEGHKVALLTGRRAV